MHPNAIKVLNPLTEARENAVPKDRRKVTVSPRPNSTAELFHAHLDAIRRGARRHRRKDAPLASSSPPSMKRRQGAGSLGPHLDLRRADPRGLAAGCQEAGPPDAGIALDPIKRADLAQRICRFRRWLPPPPFARPAASRVRAHYGYTVWRSSPRAERSAVTPRGAGLPVAQDCGWPAAIPGSGAGLNAWRSGESAAKRPCGVGWMFCLRCAEPRRPALGMARHV